MNTVFAEFGLSAWKPLLTTLLLPPVPFLLLALWGALLLWARRTTGWPLTLIALLGLWLGTCAGVGEALAFALLKPPPALSAQQMAALKREAATQPVAIVVLGGGRETFAPEYGTSSLSQGSLERLRYGVWLGRETGIPLAFSGGVGWSQANGSSEAQIAARVASAEFGRPLLWTEGDSRDTRENAQRTVALLSRAGVTRLVIVTHGWHMPRAMRAFQDAAAGRMQLSAAPMALAPRVDRPLFMWLPTPEGTVLVRNVLRESAGLLFGS